jgi:LmbE family N-acetylglucosaminyl deacetylase
LDMPDEQRSMLSTLGVHGDRITAAVDVSAYLDRKRGAMQAHASQISDTSFFLMMPPEAFAAVWGTEWYIRVEAERSPAVEDSLLAPT